MLEKNKTYTYDELKKIFIEAQREVIAKETSDLKKAEEKNGGEHDPMMAFVIGMQSMSACANLFHILFKDEKEEE